LRYSFSMERPHNAIGNNVSITLVTASNYKLQRSKEWVHTKSTKR
jgi:hypothetical protein